MKRVIIPESEQRSICSFSNKAEVVLFACTVAFFLSFFFFLQESIFPVSVVLWIGIVKKNSQ